LARSDADNTAKTKAVWPDIKFLMRRVHTMKSANHDKGETKGWNGDYLYEQRRGMQQAASATISDPVPLSLLLHLYDSPWVKATHQVRTQSRLF
jgi:hypothetical protein